MGGFGERLKIAFGNARNAEIARKLRVSEPAVKNYVQGRIPNLETLITIRNLTGRSLDWLITGDEAATKVADEDVMIARVREIVREEMRQASIVRDVDGVDEVDDMDVTIEPVRSSDVMLAPVVAHIGPPEKKAESPVGDTADDIRTRLIKQNEIDEIERRLKGKRRRTG